jgi:hypothetical protein
MWNLSLLRAKGHESTIALEKKHDGHALLSSQYQHGHCANLKLAQSEVSSLCFDYASDSGGAVRHVGEAK